LKRCEPSRHLVQDAAKIGGGHPQLAIKEKSPSSSCGSRRVLGSGKDQNKKKQSPIEIEEGFGHLLHEGYANTGRPETHRTGEKICPWDPVSQGGGPLFRFSADMKTRFRGGGTFRSLTRGIVPNFRPGAGLEADHPSFSGRTEIKVPVG